MVAAADRLKRETTFVGVDNGKWVKCEAIIAQMDVNGELICEGDVCSVNCTDGFIVEGPTKAKCIKGDNDQWFFNKDLGVCVEAFNPDWVPEEADPEPDVAGDDGKWQKCEPTPIDNGKISCIGTKCTLFCKEGFMVEGRVIPNVKKSDSPIQIEFRAFKAHQTLQLKAFDKPLKEVPMRNA